MKMSLTKDDLRAIKDIFNPKFNEVNREMRRMGVLLEDIDDKFTGVIDGIAGIHQQLDPLRTVPDDIAEIKTDVKAIKTVVMNHEARITKLEAI